MPYIKDKEPDDDEKPALVVAIGDKGLGAMGEKRAFRDLRKALEAGDDEAGAAALKKFAEACGWSGSEPDGDE
jgi:hypothetical protein